MRCADKGSIVVSLDCAFVIGIVNKNFFPCFSVHGIKFESSSAGFVPVNNSDWIESVFLHSKIKCCIVGTIIEAKES